MIFYYSATGNCRHVAKCIAKALDDKAVSIIDFMSENTKTDLGEEKKWEIRLEKDEVLGMVTSTTFWELPIPVREFLSDLSVESSGDNYTFLISTYGTTPGCTAEEAKQLMLDNSVLLDAAYSIKMPDNWTVWFDLSNPEKVAKQNAKADVAIEKVIKRIQKRDLGNHSVPRTPYFLKPLTDSAFTNARQTSNLHLEDTCIGCGLCAKNCPVNAIEMKDKKPVWVKDHCALCFACLHRCPEFAIQYGNGETKKHGQYVHPDS